MRYEQSLIDQIQTANDIVEVISQFVSLKRAGRNFKAVCPFHQEKTPSFMVNPEKQIFHCFGCGVGGDVFSFLMRYENLNFAEAVRALAEKANIRLPEPSTSQSHREGPTESERLYEICRIAQEFYHRQLLDSQGGKRAREYMQKRGYGPEFLAEFGVGWAADAWRNLFEHLSQKGFPESLLLKSGLIQRSKGRCYDVFRGRVLFPIQNLRGKVVGFGGRLIAASEGPKYLNSPETPIFQKRKELFGLHLAKRHIDNDRPVILVVEGYMDFFRLYEKGFKNSVATLGTSLTPDHVRLLKRFVQEAVVIYDGDKAGESAALRGLEIFLEEGLNVKLVRLPAGFDPDDFLQKQGKEAFQTLLDQAKDFFDYKIEILLQKYSIHDPVGIVQITNQFLETLSKIKQPVLLAHYLKRLAAAVHLDENSLRTELNRLTHRRPRSNAPKNNEIREESRKFSPEEILVLGLMLQNSVYLDEASESLQPEDFYDPLSKELFSKMMVLEDGETQTSPAKLLHGIRSETLKGELAQLLSKDWDRDTQDRIFQDCVKKIKKRKIERELQDLRTRIAKAEKEGDLHQVGEFVSRYQVLLRSLPS